MSTIFVRAKEGRIAFADEAGKTRIPSDRYVPVQETPWIARLLHHFGDIELKPESGPAPDRVQSSDASTPVKSTKAAKNSNA